MPTAQYKHRLERRGRPERALRLGLVARGRLRLGVQESRKRREKLRHHQASVKKAPRPSPSVCHAIQAPLGEEGSTGESSKVRVSSKGKAQTRCSREQKEERKAVESPSFSREST